MSEVMKEADEQKKIQERGISYQPNHISFGRHPH